jgi:nucleotide-binding universal stress UspA family protein
MFEKILLPLDGSELAETAIPYAEELASRLGSEIMLYHVYRRGHQSLQHMHQMYLDRLVESVQNNIKKSRRDNAEVKVTTKVEAGEPAVNICNLVDKDKIDLIIMTAVSASGLKIGKMLGSVADHLCRTVPIPVMLVRLQNAPRIDRSERLIDRLLIPLDGSEFSKQALPVGEELASRLGVSATLYQMANMVRVYDNGMGSEAYINYTKVDDIEKKRVEAEMVTLENDLKQRGLNINHIVTSGWDAANEIIELCKKSDIDLVIMSTQGRSGVSRWVFGNVAEKVLRHGQTPILLIKARAS